MKKDKKSANAQLLATVTPRYFLARLKLGMWLRGRSPGLQDLVHRLPKLVFNIKTGLSGMWMNPRLLTVAGAA